MTHRRRFNPLGLFSLQLEQRTVPTVTAAVVGTTLQIRGVSNGDVVVTQVGCQAFTVTDNSATIVLDNALAPVRDLDIKFTGDHPDFVTVDLHGFTAGNVTAALGDGENDFTIGNGTARGLMVTGGTGTDTYNLGFNGGAGPVVIGQGVPTTLALSYAVLYGGAGDDLLNVGGTTTFGAPNVVPLGTSLLAATNVEGVALFEGVVVNGSVSADRADVVTLGGAGTINGNLSVNLVADPVGEFVSLLGNVSGSVTVRGQDNAAADRINVDAYGTVGGDLSVSPGQGVTAGGVNASLFGGGTIRGQFNVFGGGGSDQVIVGVGTTIGTALNLRLGAGDDRVLVGGAGAIGRTRQTLYAINIATAAGNDTVLLDDSNLLGPTGPTVSGGMIASLGDGNDTLALLGSSYTQQRAPSLFDLDGGAGVDALFDLTGVVAYNTPTSATKRVVNFEPTGYLYVAENSLRGQTPSPGGNVTYTVTISNYYGATATGVGVTDVLPANVTNVVWTAAYGGGATGNTTGIGNINEKVTLPGQSFVTYTIYGTVSQTAGGTTLDNTVTLTPPVGFADVFLGDNTFTYSAAVSSFN